MYQNSRADLLTTNARRLFALIDTAIYTLLAFMYEIFFNVANADLFTNEMVFHFYKRVQLIIGVYMVFQLAIIIMKGIFNTDEVSGKNNNEFVKRVIIALVMLTVLTPISIPNASNEYEEQLNDNGLLFGTLYSLQRRILSNNTVGRLVLGTNDKAKLDGKDVDGDKDTGVSGELTEKQNLTKSANLFATTMLKGFVRINTIPDKLLEPVDEDQPPEVKNNNRMCTNIEDADLLRYLSEESKPGDILELVDRTCVPSTTAANRKTLHDELGVGLLSKKRFQFAYMPLITTVVGIFFIFLLITFTIDVAVRAIKIAVLRLIAPIPVISYMDPKGSKDSGFNAWVKALTTTYLDLFIRLATIYFVIYLIQDMRASGVKMAEGPNVIGGISFVFICIGLFFFAKEAPKFIQQALGLKSEPMNIFGRTLGTTAALAGVAGAFNAGRAASRLADETRQAAGQNVDPNGLLNRGKHLLAGFAGGLGGIGTGLSAVGSAKDHQAKAAFDAMQKRNRDAIAKGNAGSTFLGRTGSTLYSEVFGESKSNADARSLKSLEAKSKANSALVDLAEKKITTSAGWTTGTSTYNGKTITGSYKDWMIAYDSAKASKADKFTFNGVEVTLDEAGHLDNDLKESNAADFIKRKGVNPRTGAPNKEFDILVEDYDSMYGQGEFARVVSTQTSGLTGNGARKVFKDAATDLDYTAAKTKRENVIQEANDQYSGGKK